MTKVLSVIFNLVAAFGLLTLGWKSNPSVVEQWLITGVLTCCAAMALVDAVVAMAGDPD